MLQFLSFSLCMCHRFLLCRYQQAYMEHPELEFLVTWVPCPVNEGSGGERRQLVATLIVRKQWMGGGVLLQRRVGGGTSPAPRRPRHPWKQFSGSWQLAWEWEGGPAHPVEPTPAGGGSSPPGPPSRASAHLCALCLPRERTHTEGSCAN